MNAETYLKTSSNGHTTSTTDSPPQAALSWFGRTGLDRAPGPLPGMPRA